MCQLYIKLAAVLLSPCGWLEMPEVEAKFLPPLAGYYIHFYFFRDTQVFLICILITMPKKK